MIVRLTPEAYAEAIAMRDNGYVMKRVATSPSRPEEHENPETVRIIEARLKTADKEPRRGDEGLESIRQKRRKQHPVSR